MCTKAAAVCAAGSIQAVIVRCQCDISAGNDNGFSFNAFIALCNIDCSAGNDGAVVCVNAVVA